MNRNVVPICQRILYLGKATLFAGQSISNNSNDKFDESVKNKPKGLKTKYTEKESNIAVCLQAVTKAGKN